MSQIEVRVNNTGAGASTAPTTVSFNLPANVTAPLKFSRVADSWVCTTSGQVVSCTYDKSLLAGNNTRLRIPVTPVTGTVNTSLSAFRASVAPDALESNLADNGPVSMTPATAVAPLVLSTIPPFNPDGSSNLTNRVYGSNDLIDPVTIPKYALPLPNLFASFYKHQPDNTAINKYNLDIKRVKAQILPPGFPATDVFAYGDPSRPDTFSYPAHTIEARSTNSAVNASGLGKATQVQYLNTLLDTNNPLAFFDEFGTFTSIVDNTIVGANSGHPFAVHAPQTELPEPEVRSVAHLHGALRNGDDVNGHPEAWYAPDGRNGFNVALALDPLSQTPSVPFNPNPFSYSNNQEASLLWYHDNTLGIARHNVYAGLEGLYVIRDDNEMAKIANNQLPASQHEIPLVLQDRMFHKNGSLAYPAVNIDSLNAPVPSWVPEAYGDVMVVNGVAWPYLQVEPRLYRFRLLNASNSRFYKLSLQDNISPTAPISFKVIGTDGGLLNAPVTTTTLTMAPGERYDVVVDFSSFKGKNITLKNAAGNLFGNALARPEVKPTAGLVDQIMQIRVNLPKSNAPLVTLPTSLRSTSIPTLTATAATPRKLLLWETINDFSRLIPIMGTPDQGLKYWTDPVTENPVAGTVETWEIYNNTFYPEPIHIEGATIQVVNRQEFTAVLNENLLSDLPFIDGQLTQFAFPSAAVTPAASEAGWKDTVIAYPSPNRVTGVLDGGTVNGNVTRIRVRFDSPAGQYTWHSQRLEHQEHEMIRPLTVKNSLVYYVDAANIFGKLDLSTGTRTPIGNTGITMTDVAVDSSGNIYATSWDNLYRINPTTGAATYIGNSLFDTNALAFGADGKLYGSNRSGLLYTLSTVDGSPTLIGNGNWGGAGSSGDLLFLNNSLYLSTTANQLLKYDLANGQISVAVSNLPADTWGLAKVGNNIYSATNTGAIYTLNLTTGSAAATGVISAGSEIYGLDN